MTDPEPKQTNKKKSIFFEVSAKPKSKHRMVRSNLFCYGAMHHLRAMKNIDGIVC